MIKLKIKNSIEKWPNLEVIKIVLLEVQIILKIAFPNKWIMMIILEDLIDPQCQVQVIEHKWSLI